MSDRRLITVLATAAIGLVGAGTALGQVENVQVVGRIKIPHASDVVLSGDRAYVGGKAGALHIVDVSAPNDPQLLGKYETPTIFGLLPGQNSLAVTGDLAYVATEIIGARLQVLDVSDPKVPKLLCRYDKFETGGVRDFDVSGKLAYMTTTWEGIFVLDVSRPEAPVKLDLLKGIAAYGATAAAGDRLYVTACSGPVPGATLVILDVSKPNKRVRLGGAAVPSREVPSSLAVNESTAAVACDRDGVHIFDITDPAKPRCIRSISIPGRALDVDLDDECVYVAAGDAGLRIFDTKGDRAIAFETKGTARALALSKQYVYLADESEGLLIFEKVFEGGDTGLERSRPESRQKLAPGDDSTSKPSRHPEPSARERDIFDAIRQRFVARPADLVPHPVHDVLGSFDRELEISFDCPDGSRVKRVINKIRTTLTRWDASKVPKSETSWACYTRWPSSPLKNALDEHGRLSASG